LRTESADRRHIALTHSLRQFSELAQHADDIVAGYEAGILSLALIPSPNQRCNFIRGFHALAPVAVGKPLRL
jgi:hypothetical protein